MLIDIALDAVGTDKAPEAEIAGHPRCEALPVRVHLVGPEAELRDLLDEALGNEDLPIVIHNATERIAWKRAAHAVRTKKDSSMRVGSSWCARRGGGLCHSRQHRRGHGHAKMVLGALREWTVRLSLRRCQLQGNPVCCWTWAQTSIAKPAIWRSLP